MGDSPHLATFVLIVTFHSVATLAFALDEDDAGKAPPTVEGRVTDGFRLSLQAKRTKLSVGEPVELWVTLTNASKANLTIFETTAFADIYLTVDQDDRRVPLTRLGLLYENREKWQKVRNQPIGLKPGESRRYSIAANLFYDMTLSGTYQLYAAYRVPARGEVIPEGWRKVRAGPVTIELTRP